MTVTSMQSSKTTKDKVLTRRGNKPMMEKRRRARINTCLDQIKSAIIETSNKDPARYAKLEKADILEMCVKEFQFYKRSNASLVSAVDPTVLNQYRAGWDSCVEELRKYPGLDPEVKKKLMGSLTTNFDRIIPDNQKVVTVVPTRLVNGELALVLQDAAHQVPHTTCPNSRSYSPQSAPNSPQHTALSAPNSPRLTPQPHQLPPQPPQLPPQSPPQSVILQPQRQPLCLVVKDKECWRPW